MKRDAVSKLIILIVGILFLSVSCATTTTVEPIEQGPSEVLPTTPSEEVAVVTTSESVAPITAPSEANIERTSIARLVQPKRIFRYGEAPRYGDHLIISNETGYSLVQLDIFNQSMYQVSDQLVNLLGSDELMHHGQKKIALSEFPLLQEALGQQNGDSFTVNTIDTDGDRYILTWLAESDSWNIEITEDALYFSLLEMDFPPSQGDYFIITNNTGYPLRTLFAIDPTAIEDMQHTNLLGEMTVASGSAVQIDTEDVPWIASQLPFAVYGRVKILAQDTDGDYYEKLWYPTTDVWNIELTIADLVYDDPTVLPDVNEVYIENNTSFELWYLYLTSEELLADHSYGEDLLEDSTLDSGEGIYIDLSRFSHLYGMLGSKEPLYFIGLDIDDNEYHLQWTPSDDGWSIELTDENFLPLPLPEALYDYTTLLIDNLTDEDIWYLYMVTDAMADAYDNGKDVLGDVIWRAGATQAIVPEAFSWIASSLGEHPDSLITLIAENYDGELYMRQWNPLIHGWLIDISPDDLQQ